jgi:hypothetical protein
VISDRTVATSSGRFGLRPTNAAARRGPDPAAAEDDAQALRHVDEPELAFDGRQTLPVERLDHHQGGGGRYGGSTELRLPVDLAEPGPQVCQAGQPSQGVLAGQ